MSLVGPQNYWVVGSRCRFKREATDTQKFPLQDLGTVQTVEPGNEVTTIELNDPGCGILVKVDEAVTQIDETYVLTLNNFAPDVLQYLFLSTPAVEYTRTETPHADGSGDCGFQGQLVQVLNAAGEAEFNLKSVEAVRFAADIVGIDITGGIGSMTFDLDGDYSNMATVTTLVLTGNSFAGPVTTNAISAFDAVTGLTTITVDEDITTGDAAGTVSFVTVENTDWAIDARDFGTIKIITGGNLFDGATLEIDYTNNAVSGERQLKPQSASIIRGEMLLFFNRGNCEEISVRRAQVTLSPTSFDTAGTEDYASWQLNVSVISTQEELLAGDGIGDFTYVKGDMPAAIA